MNNENEASIDYLSEFSTLMRQILDNSAKSKVLLKTEIEMLRSYIQLEHLRFDCFTWNIIPIATGTENVQEDTIEVPGMIVQPFVENAILHGLVPKVENGRLVITFERDDKHIVCTVEDNGIGRERSYELNRKKNKDRQSHGVDIATNRLILLNDKKKD
jgi:LytS/YehU family sensor histidine kinase